MSSITVMVQEVPACAGRRFFSGSMAATSTHSSILWRCHCDAKLHHLRADARDEAAVRGAAGGAELRLMPNSACMAATSAWCSVPGS
jgi:hypothetical protein